MLICLSQTRLNLLVWPCFTTVHSASFVPNLVHECLNLFK